MCSGFDPITVKYLPRDLDTGEVQKLRFENLRNTIRHPLMMFGDMEALLIKIDESGGKYT